MKGLVLSFEEFIACIVLLVMIIYVVFMWHTSYFDLNFIVSVADEQRKMINLAQIIVSSPRIAVIRDDRLKRAVLDSSKLANLGDLCNDILYPNTSYEVKIKDLDNGNSWSTTCGSIQPDATYQMFVPLSIRYSDFEVHVGEMNLTFKIKR